MKHIRCSFCNKKAGLFAFTCKCDDQKHFCSKHRNDHNCTYDYHEEFKKQLLKENPVIKSSKLNKID